MSSGPAAELGSALFSVAPDILALVGDAVVSADEHGRILLFNRSAERIFGYDAAEVIGQPVEILLPARFRTDHAEEVRSFAAGEASATRVMGHRREVSGRRKNGEEFPVEASLSRSTLGGRTIVTVAVRDISERRRNEDELHAQHLALQKTEQRLRLALKGGQMGTWEWDLESGNLEADGLARRLFALPETGPLDVQAALDRVHEDDLAELRDALTNAIEGGTDYQHEFRVANPGGRDRWVAGKGALLRAQDGTAQSVIGVAFDVTERREIEEQRRLLSSELNHRVKNVMAVVQSIVTLSAGSAQSIESYRESLHGRLGAVARSHSLLLQSGWSSTTLMEQLLSELGPYRNESGTNIVLNGPAISFDPQAGLSLGLAIHELATNAAKYGALSLPSGKVEIHWEVEDAPEGRRLALCWVEAGGPVVASPERHGFGTKLIERTLQRSLGGEVETEWRAEGLRCRILLPLERIAAPQQR